ncbi:MAG: acyl-CoA dehydrogenase family protein [Burkholderiales bacterium]|nr:acyl-CoA dehydrogenase family protein [Burkholderiales bacterium]
MPPSALQSVNAATRLDEREIETRLAQLVEALAATAAERDRAGGHAAQERERIRASGLLRLSVPRRYGGEELEWPRLYGIVRRVAAVDASLAHLYAFHHLQVATVLLYGDAAQHERYLVPTIRENWFWGNALNPLDPRLVATPVEDGYRLDGEKGFCSGARGSDRLIVSARLRDSDALIVAVLPTRAAGVTVLDDWDAFGQRQTDSGTVRFENVRVPHEAVLRDPGPNGSVRASLRTCLAQLVLTNLYVGIAQGALAEARRYVLTRTRPWPTSSAASAAEDPYVLHRFGELQIQLSAAVALADDAAERLQAAWALGEGIDAQTRGQTALAIAQAKVFAARAGLDLCSRVFDLMGASSVAGRLALDRYWRNLRTHSLHDPLDYKTCEVGEWVLHGRVPTPSSYS